METLLALTGNLPIHTYLKFKMGLPSSHQSHYPSYYTVYIDMKAYYI